MPRRKDHVERLGGDQLALPIHSPEGRPDSKASRHESGVFTRNERMRKAWRGLGALSCFGGESGAETDPGRKVGCSGPQAAWPLSGPGISVVRPGWAGMSTVLGAAGPASVQCG